LAEALADGFADGPGQSGVGGSAKDFHAAGGDVEIAFGTE
jgi:hypothetical protein